MRFGQFRAFEITHWCVRAQYIYFRAAGRASFFTSRRHVRTKTGPEMGDISRLTRVKKALILSDLFMNEIWPARKLSRT